MERRINNKLDEYLTKLKTNVAKKFENVNMKETNPDTIRNQYLEILGYIYNYEKLSFSKDDFMKRKRVKSVVPIYDRCCAKRANGEQCTRRKKDGETYCGTHIKGTPNNVVEENKETQQNQKNVKVDIWAQDIKGIIYYIDKNNNVYDTEDIMNNDKYPKRIIAKYIKDNNNNYSIPELFA